MSKKILGFTLFLGFLLLSNCAKTLDLENIELPKPELALPIADANSSLEKIVGKFDSRAFLRVDAGGQLTMQYKGSLISKTTTSIFAQFQNIFFPLSDTVTNLPFNIPNGVRLDSVDLKSGQVRSTIFMVGQFNEPLNITMRIPQMRKRGVPFSWTYRTTGPLLTGNIDSTDLAGYSIIPNNDSIRVYYDARKVSTGERVKINTFFAVMRNFQFGYAQGYLGANDFNNDPDTIRLDLFNKFTTGEVWFQEPKITVTLQNSFGVPTRSIVRYADIISANGSVLPIRSSIITSGVSAAYPSFREIGQTKTTIITFDKSNSNLDSVIAAAPVALAYDIDGVMDSTGRVTGYMTDSSSFAMLVDVELPLHLRAQGFELTDTIAASMSALNENANKAELKIVADNGLPLDVVVQGYFLNNAGMVVDSLFSRATAILKGATVDNNGEVTQPTQQITLIGIDETRRVKLATATRLAVKYALSTSLNGTRPVKLRQSQALRVRLGLSFVPKL